MITLKHPTKSQRELENILHKQVNDQRICLWNISKPGVQKSALD